MPKGFNFSIFLTTHHYLSSWLLLSWWVWNRISLWFWSAFFWYLLMLNIFPGAYWPFACLICRNIYLAPLPIFKLDYFCFYYSIFLKYSWFTMLCQSLLYRKLTQFLYIYAFFFNILFYYRLSYYSVLRILYIFQISVLTR